MGAEARPGAAIRAEAVGPGLVEAEAVVGVGPGPAVLVEAAAMESVPATV